MVVEARSPNGWPQVRLGDACRVVNGTTPRSTNGAYWNGEIVWITPADLGQLGSRKIHNSNRRISKAGFDSCGLELVPAGTVVLSTRAPIGHLGIAEVPLCTNQGCKSLVPGNDVDSLYLYFALRYAVPELRSIGSGATFSEISKTQVGNFAIPLPPLVEQRRIAARLNEQMAHVARARAAAEERLRLARLLPELASVAAVDGDATESVLDDALFHVTEGIGAEWAEYEVVGATRAGVAPAKEKVGKTPQRYKPVDDQTVFYNPMRILEQSIAMLPPGAKRCITSPDYVVVKGREGVLNTRWFYHWLRSAAGLRFIKDHAKGAVRPRLTWRFLSEARLRIPSWQSQLKVLSLLEGHHDILNCIEREFAKIDALPAVLLRAAFRQETS